MASARKPDALAHLHTEHDALRTLLAQARAKAAADLPGDAPAAMPARDGALREALPALRHWLRRRSRLEYDLFYPALEEGGADEVILGYARAEHELHCRLLERAEELAVAVTRVDDGESDDGQFHSSFNDLAERLLRHAEWVERTVFPLARRLGLDLAAIGQRMQALPPEEDEPPAATETEDGRLDIGTGEDRNPTL